MRSVPACRAIDPPIVLTWPVRARDFDHEENVHLNMQPYATEIKEAVQNSRPISEAALDAMMRIQEGDRATRKIKEVVSRG